MAVHRAALRTAPPPPLYAWRAARLGTRVISWDRVNFRRPRRLGPFSRLAFGLDEAATPGTEKPASRGAKRVRSILASACTRVVAGVSRRPAMRGAVANDVGIDCGAFSGGVK